MRALGRSARYIRLWSRSRSALRYALDRSLIGLEFARFGRRLGRRLLRRGSRQGLNYLLSPVSTFRYFEFPFAAESLPSDPGSCLDVGSPRLFSFYVAAHHPAATIDLLNPDPADIEETRAVVAALGTATINPVADEVAVLTTGPARAYDTIWSISVVEHIAGDYDDRAAMKMMYDALKPGGHLIVTVPVDRSFREDFRDEAHYVTAARGPDSTFFFQRVYDERAMFERLIDPLGETPVSLRWYGETRPGRFTDYERRWSEKGMEQAVEDPREMADGYTEFSSFEEMPGFGVCGILIKKTR